MRSVDIFCWGLMILVKKLLESVFIVSMCACSVRIVTRVLLDLMLFLICFMFPFSVATEGG